MSLRTRQSLVHRTAAENPQDALEYEIAHEMASTLGRLGREFERTLAALLAHDAATATRSSENRRIRMALVREASTALWHFVVQREAIGLRDTTRLLRDYKVPNEVRDRMGAFPPG